MARRNFTYRAFQKSGTISNTLHFAHYALKDPASSYALLDMPPRPPDDNQLSSEYLLEIFVEENSPEKLQALRSRIPRA